LIDEGNSVTDASSAAAQKQIIGLDILTSIAGTVGLTCDPISVLAISGTKW
jgi:hypothetical protein